MRFTAAEWNAWDEVRREQVLQNYRLAYRADTMVNWCPKLGTVLANDEVRDGLSVRGGYPVEQKRMKQWLLRVTAYAQRMLDGLEGLEWSDSLKEIQRNWMAVRLGARALLDIQVPDRRRNLHHASRHFGVTFMVIVPPNTSGSASSPRLEKTGTPSNGTSPRRGSARSASASPRRGA